MKNNRTVAPVAAFLLLFLLLLPVISMAGGVEEIVVGLQSKYEKINSISADFTQEVAQKAMGKPQVSEGKVYFKKPGKMRWEYLKPVKDQLVSNGKTVWMWQPDLNQVFERPAEKAGSSMATDFLSGMGNLKKDFSMEIEGERDGAWRLKLTPRAAQPNLKRVFLEVEKEGFLVRKTVIEDHFGNETRVTFSDIKVNPAIQDSLFNFKAPKGAMKVRP